MAFDSHDSSNGVLSCARYWSSSHYYRASKVCRHFTLFCLPTCECSSLFRFSHFFQFCYCKCTSEFQHFDSMCWTCSTCSHSEAMDCVSEGSQPSSCSCSGSYESAKTNPVVSLPAPIPAVQALLCLHDCLHLFRGICQLNGLVLGLQEKDRKQLWQPGFLLWVLARFCLSRAKHHGLFGKWWSLKPKHLSFQCKYFEAKTQGAYKLVFPHYSYLSVFLKDS